MGRKTTRLPFGVFLGVLGLSAAACTLSSMPATPDYGATQTAFAFHFNQLATPTLTPTPTDTLTPTPTDPFSLTHLPEALPTFFTPGVSPTTGPRPLHYTLRAGEYPWCIARRFNVEPKELLALNNLRSGMIYPKGMVLAIPQNGGAFPGTRALHPHPAAYTVSAAQTTVYKVACHFGDVDPDAIMQHNGLTSPILTFGQVLQIP